MATVTREMRIEFGPKARREAAKDSRSITFTTTPLTTLSGCIKNT